MKTAFLGAFARFPAYDFVWKYNKTVVASSENETALFTQYPNVHVFSWVAQRAMLQHLKLRAFITHCDMNSPSTNNLDVFPFGYKLN